MDGLKATHDLYRHSRSDMGPTYDRVMETAQMFQSYGVEFNVLTVVNRQTAGQIKKFINPIKAEALAISSILPVWILWERRRAAVSIRCFRRITDNF